MNFRRVLWTGYKRSDGTCDVKIYVRTPEGKKYYSTDIKIEPKYWKKNIGEVKPDHPMAELYNSKINALKMELEHYFRSGGTFDGWGDHKKIGSGSLLSFLENFIEEATDGKHGLTAGTVRGYKGLLLRLRQFAEKSGKQDFKFSEIDMGWLNKFWDMLLSQGCAMEGGIGNHTKRLKRIMKTAGEKGLHNNMAYETFKVYVQPYSNKIYLNESEIQAMEDVVLSAVLDKERIRFLIAYYFLLRYSDVVRINKKHFFTNGGKHFFRIKHQKTKNEVVIPVKPNAQRLLEQVDYNLGYTANPVANRNIKLVAAMAGINDIVKQGDESSPKSQFVTFHTARRSAATNLYLSGVSTKLIADLGGWTNEKTLKVYLRASGLDSAFMASDLDFFK